MCRKFLKSKALYLTVMLILSLGLSTSTVRAGTADFSAPQKAAENVMNAIKTLDFKTFNEGTDNYVRTYRNFIGIPTGREYRIFNELLQPSIIKTKKYKDNHRFAKLVMKRLTWNIKDVRTAGNQAEIDLEVTNTDLTDVMGRLEIECMEEMIHSSGTGLIPMIKDLAELDYDKGRLISCIEAEKDTATINVTVDAAKDNNKWKLHISDSFSDALMGNLGAEEYSEEINSKLAQLESAYENKMEQWGDDLEDNTESFMEHILDIFN